MATEITSSDLIPIETSFRLKAGPGAGKTYWLINHVHNVLNNSMRLNGLGKIACLTYSNVGVDTITERLGYSARVEVSTLHSFLYTNIIKPYFYLIADDEGFNLDLFSGIIDDYVLDNYPTCKAVSEHCEQPIQFALWSKYLKSLKWKIVDKKISCSSTQPIIKGKTNKNGKKYGDVYASNSVGLFYKKLAWAQGILNYDDVNYFALKLIIKYRWITKILAISFPYIFIDEFQDTNPLQAIILQTIGKNRETRIGIIGDTAQSIYKFQGASPTIFNGFKVPNLIELEIKNNRRSLAPIVKFLNMLRKDLRQTSIRTDVGVPVRFLIGDKKDAFSYIEKQDMDCLVLSYANVDTNSLRYQFCEKRGIVKTEKLDNIEDSNLERKKLVSYLIQAIENGRNGKFRYAFAQIERAGISEEQSLLVLRDLISISDIDQMSLKDFVDRLIKEGVNVAPVTKGNCLAYYQLHKYGEFAQDVKIEDDKSEQRTIHKAKGDEATNVLVTTGKGFSPKTLLDYNLISNESHRVYYVAMSRARDRLFIQFPSLTTEMEKFFREKWNIEIIRLKVD